MIAYAGSAAGRLLADRVGLTGQLSAALARRSFTPVHDRGRVAGVGPPARRVARLLDTKRGHRVKYSVGFAVTNAVRDAIALVPKDA